MWLLSLPAANCWLLTADFLKRIPDTKVPDYIFHSQVVELPSTAFSEGWVAKRCCGINPENEKRKIKSEPNTSINGNFAQDFIYVKFPSGVIFGII